MGTGTHGRTSTSPRLGEMFGRYVLLERIGAGGMAEVFRAVATGPEGFQRAVVIKRILPHLSLDADFVKMFVDEAKLCGLLSHPNLVQTFEFGKIGESFFIVMEHVHGKTLSALRNKLGEQHRMMPVAAAVEIIRQLCVGLHYAHGARSPEGKPLGIVHRDVSPANVMLAYHGGVKILDFGIAHVASDLRQSRTEVGAMKGKVGYMSPEQLRHATHPTHATIDGRADIFAVGVVLHELLTGQRLFRSDSDLLTSRLSFEIPIVPPSQANPDVPAALDDVVMRAVQRQPEARYATAGEMAAALEEVLPAARGSSQEHTRLLHELFPEEVSDDSDMLAGLGMAAPANAAAGDERPTSHLSHNALSVASAFSEAGTPSPTRSMPSGEIATGPVRPRGSRWMGLGIGATVVAAAALITLWATPRSRSAATEPAAAAARAPEPAAAPSAPAVVAAAPAVPAAAALPPNPTVHCSLDSSPQDAVVIAVDSGREIGRTPVALTLPRSTEPVSFRLEKPGYETVVYKIIPDMEKSLRIDLPADSARRPADGPARTAATGRPGVPRPHPARSETAEPTAASDTLVDPFAGP